MNSIDSRINLTDEQIEAAFEALGYGLTVDDLEVTYETIDDYLQARPRWREPGRLVRHDTSVLVIECAQARKGMPRNDVVLIDFGVVRLSKSFG